MKKIYVLMMALLTVSLIQAQVTLVKDIFPGVNGSTPAYFTDFDGEMYFRAYDTNGDNQLFKSDGTNAGTVMILANELTTAGLSNPDELWEFNGELYFKCRDAGFNNMTYKYNGSDISQVRGSDYITSHVVVGATCYFVTSSNEIWSTDGSTETQLVSTGYRVEKSIVAVGDNIIFYSWDTNTNAGYIYTYNTTSGAITQIDTVKDFAFPTVIGSTAYFAYSKFGSWSLYETDGSTVTKIDVTNGIFASRSLFAWNNKLFFSGNNGNGEQLYVYDPNGGSLTDISQIGSDGLSLNNMHIPRRFTVLGDDLYYAGVTADESNTNMYSLYKTDGTTVTSVDEQAAYIQEMTAYKGELYLSCLPKDDFLNNGNIDVELYKYSPTPTAIGDEVAANAITVAPNPSYGMVNVSGIVSANASYEIYDLSGKCIEKSMISSSNQINYKVGAGIYILKVTDAANTRIIKMIVK